MEKVTVALKYHLQDQFMTAITVTMGHPTRTSLTARSQRSRRGTLTVTTRWAKVIPWMRSISPTAGHVGKWSAARGPSSGTRATNVEKPTQRLQIWAGTNRRTGAWTARWPKSARHAGKCTCPCQPWPCTCLPMTSSTSATYVAKRSADLGYCRVTCALTRVRSHLDVHTVEKRLPTAPTCGRTCRRTRRSSITNASDATKLSRSSPTWTSTTSPRASKARSRHSGLLKHDFRSPNAYRHFHPITF